MTDRYAVIGNPVEHSKSPEIHQQFAIQTGEAIIYEKLVAPLNGFVETLQSFVLSGGCGMNITVPFKQQAWALAGVLSEKARRAGAVNTMTRLVDGTLSGDNTDGIGLVRDLQTNIGLKLSGCRILLVGAGGAARGVVAPLLEQHPALMVIANRTVARAVGLAALFADQGIVKGCGFDDLDNTPYDLIINATSAGLQSQVPPLPHGSIGAQTLCYDMLYADSATDFVKFGRQRGASRSVDGLGMLVEQAAESFFLWRGIRPNTEAVIAGLRAAQS